MSNKRIAKLIQEAKAKYPGQTICPCTGKTWKECIAENMFWFNTPDHSTHVIKIEITITKE
jgi:hypothetical protein